MALTQSQNDQIAALQDQYKAATTQEERDRIHNEANAIRSSAGEASSWGASDGNNSSTYKVNNISSSYEDTYKKYTSGSDTSSNNKVAQQTTSENTSGKTLGEIATEVLSGKWGSGNDRIKALTDAGYDYKTVQNAVNDIYYGRKKASELSTVLGSTQTATTQQTTTPQTTTQTNNTKQTSTQNTTYNATNWQSAPVDVREEARRTPALVGYTSKGAAIYQTTVDDMNGIRTGYIINGQCYYDKNGTEPINSSAVYYTSGSGVIQKLSDGTLIDYAPVQEKLRQYQNDEITEEELDEFASATYGEAYDSLIGKNSDTTNVKYSETSITPSAATVSESISGMNATDATQYIISLYEQSAESALQQLKTSYDKSIAELDESVAEIKAISQTYKNSITAQQELALINLNEELAASNLSAGAAMQMRLSVTNAYQQKMSSFELEEAQQLEALERDRTNLYTQYQNDVAQAVIDNDLEKANALYQEYIRQDNARIQAAATSIEYAYKYAALEQDQEQFDAQMALEYESMYAEQTDDSSTKKYYDAGTSDYQQAILDIINATTDTEKIDIAKRYLISSKLETAATLKQDDTPVYDLIAAAAEYQKEYDDIDSGTDEITLSAAAQDALEAVETQMYYENYDKAQKILDAQLLTNSITQDEYNALLNYINSLESYKNYR